MALDEFFSKGQKKTLKLPEGLVVGTVIRAFVDFIDAPKEKRFIVVGFNENKIHLAIVLINTEINFIMNFSVDMVACQHELKKGDREYLTHDSFIDCSELYELDISEINRKIDDDPDLVIGCVNKEDLDGIMKTIQSSRTIKGKVKRKCGIYEYKF